MFGSLIIAVIDWIVPINSTFRDVYDISGKRIEEMTHFSNNELCLGWLCDAHILHLLQLSNGLESEPRG